MSNHVRRAVFILFCLVWVVTLLSIGPLASMPVAAQRQLIVFQGHALVDGTSAPLVGVTIELYTAVTGSGNYGLAATTTTDANGRFTFSRSYTIRTDYRIREVNPPNYVSTKATALSPGVVVNADTVDFIYPNAGSYGRIDFFDRFLSRVTSTPTATRTATRTPTRTPTRTATATSTPGPITDLVADKIEVTQAVQDLNNSVRLVKNKRTFVRVHAHSTTNGAYPTTALLLVQRGGNSTALLPINSTSVRKYPGRLLLSHSFLFELPSGFREGTVTLTAYVNPILPFIRPNHDPLETSYANNTSSTTVTFEAVPVIHIVLYRVGYKLDGVTYYPSLIDGLQLASWLRRAYPVSAVGVTFRTLYYGNASVNDDGGLIHPNCGDINALLASRVFQDIFGGQYTPGARYYGMVSDQGGFMRGCSGSIPSLVASGPTGSGTWGWDNDGSYGDWYGGHELGHAFGRYHAQFCGASGGAYYPYPNGYISPTYIGNSALYGFDIGTKFVYGPTWTDLMTYCGFEWVSDFTYEGLMTYFKSNLSSVSLAVDMSQAVDRLQVSGVIDAFTDDVTLQPLFILPDAGEIQPRVPGDYAIVLRDFDGAELARYPFTPQPMEAGPAYPGEPATPVELLLIDELVPYVEGTTRVEIEHSGAVLITITAGGATPTVTVLSPNGGETLTDDPIVVSWAGDDSDGDSPLYYRVQYSRDNGASWELLAQNLTDTSVELNAADVGSTTAGLFRVWVSDGIHTSRDESDAPFIVPNAPPLVEIVEPAQQVTVAVSQTVSLVGNAYDPDTGTMPDEQLEWSSDLDGVLGQGMTASVATLSEGVHTITFRGDDGQGGVATAHVTVVVVATLDDLPAPADDLVVAPALITLDPLLGPITETLNIENENLANPLPWSAVASEPWVLLSATSGDTPAEVVVSLDAAGLSLGKHMASITVRSEALPDDVRTIQVQAAISPRGLSLPLVLKDRGR